MINGQVFERLTNVEHTLLEHDQKFDIVFDQLQIDEYLEKYFIAKTHMLC